MMLESDGNLETYTELNAVALNLHEPHPETMWSSDLGRVPKSILQEAREKKVKKLQHFETYEEVPQAEAEGQEIISSRFVDKWEELRSRVVSRGYESSPADLASLFAAAPSVVATRIALVLGLALDVDMAVADISGASLHAVLEKPFFVTPPAEYRKPVVVWKIKRYLYCDKRAPRGWQDHFEKTMLELGFERLESEPGCFVKKGASHKDTIIVVVHVDDLLSVGKRKHLDNFFVQLEKTLKLKRVEFIENASQCCSWVTTSQSSRTRSLSRARMRMWITCSRCPAWKAANRQAHRWCERSLQQSDDQEMLEGSEAETDRSVVGILMYFKRHRFDLHYAAKSLAMAISSPTKGHMRRLKRVLRYIQGTRDMHLELIRPREQLTEMVGWCDGSWADLDEKRRSTGGGLLMLGGACVAGLSRTQKPTALSSGESDFYSATFCTCELLWACDFFFKRAGIHHDCLSEGRRICVYWHGNASGTWSIQTSTSMIICDGTSSVENLTSCQYFASGTCRYF